MGRFIGFKKRRNSQRKRQRRSGLPFIRKHELGIIIGLVCILITGHLSQESSFAQASIGNLAHNLGLSRSINDARGIIPGAVHISYGAPARTYNRHDALTTTHQPPAAQQQTAAFTPPVKKDTPVTPNKAADGMIACNSPYIIDGDTFSCGNTRIRLANIDTPEMEGHCPEWKKCVKGDPIAAKNHLSALSRGDVTCRPVAIDKFNRTVALCQSAGKDLSCAMVKDGHAVERYGKLSCST